MTRRLSLHTDGGARGNPGPAGIGWVIHEGPAEIRSGAAQIGPATNNQAEYRALIAGLRAALAETPAALEVLMDSELVVRQMQGRYRVKHADLQPLHAEAGRLLAGSPGTRVTFRHIPREQNARADELYNRALDGTLETSDEGSATVARQELLGLD